MRLKITAFLMLAIVANVFAQQKFTTYKSIYDGEEYQISIDKNPEKGFTVYFDTSSRDKIYKFCGFSIKENDYPDFIESLKKASEKYQSWIDKANENNVHELFKSTGETAKATGYFQTSGKWNFSFDQKIDFEAMFINNDDKSKYLAISTGELKSSKNSYKTCDGGVIMFRSVNEINDFLELIDIEKIKAFETQEDIFN